MFRFVLLAAAIVVVSGVFLITRYRRPTKGVDPDRFAQARRITTAWAEDAGTDMSHPAPGQPGTVDTSATPNAPAPAPVQRAKARPNRAS